MRSCPAGKQYQSNLASGSSYNVKPKNIDFAGKRLPDLALPSEEKCPIGVYAHRRTQYLNQRHKILSYNLPTSRRLHSRLVDVEEETQSLFLRLVKEYTQREDATKHLKAENPVEWVQKMNNIRSRAAEAAEAILFSIDSPVSRSYNKKTEDDL